MCKAEGSPTPLVTWTHNTQSLKSDKTVQPGKYGDLQMTNVTYLDDGFYNCYATNDLDSVSYSQTVKVTSNLTKSLKMQ